jgi:hypothetical protein
MTLPGAETAASCLHSRNVILARNDAQMVEWKNEKNRPSGGIVMPDCHRTGLGCR